MADQQKNVVIVLEPVSKTVEELVAAIEQKGQAELLKVSSPEEVAQLAPQYQPCMLITCIPDNPYIPGRVNLFKKLEKASIKSGLLKTMVISQVKNKQLAALVGSLGITDYMEEPVPLRTMQFKANLQLKAVDTIKKQQEMKKKSQEQIVFKKSEAGKNDATSQVGSKLATKSKPALQLEQDTFLFKNSGAKKVGGKYVVELEGPDPESGDWVPHEDKGNAQNSWRWVPKDEKEQEKLGGPEGKDGWVHQGEKPQFQEQSGKWQFVSEKPDLAFNRKGEALGKKLATDEAGELIVADDSPQAEEKVKSAREKIALRQKEKNPPKNQQGEKVSSKDIADTQAKSGTSESGSSEENPIEFRDLQKKGDPSTASAFSDKRNGQADSLNSFNNKLSPAEKSPIEPKSPIETGADGSVTKKKLSPLDFLKNKKATLEAGVSEVSEFGSDSKEGTETGELEPAEPVQEEETESSPKLVKKDKKNKNPTEALLARLKAKAEKGLSPKESLESSEEVEPEETLANVEEEAIEEDEIAAALEKRKLEKKKKQEEQKLKIANDPLEPQDKPSDESLVPLDRAKRNRSKREQVLAGLQEAVDEPLTDTISPAEERELRKKYDQAGAPPLKPRELKRKAKLDKLKALKERLGALDEELAALEEAHPEIRTHDLTPDTPENTQSQRGDLGMQSEGVQRRAFDSETEEAEEEDVSGKVRKKKKEDSSSKVKEGGAENVFFRQKEEITPLGGAWEKADTHYVFLAASTRYRGFESIDELLPLWIHKGDKVPELLDKSQQWQFFGSEPVKVETAKDIPSSVRDYLLELRELARQHKDSSENEDSKSPGVDDPNTDSHGGLHESLEKETNGRSKSRAEENIDLSELVTKEEKKGKKINSSLLDLIKRVEAGSEEIHGGENSEPESVLEGKDLITEDSKVEQEGRKETSPNEDDGVSSSKGGQAATLEQLFEEKSEKTKGNRRKESVMDKLAGLKAAMEGESSKFDAQRDTDQRPDGSDADNPSKEIQTTNTEEESAVSAESSEPVPLAEKLRAKSPAFEKFLARRKAKEAQPESLAEGEVKRKESLAGHNDRDQPYLAVYVALSNAFMPNQLPAKSLERIFRTLALSMEGADFVLERNGAMILSTSSRNPETRTPASKLEVTRIVDQKNEVLGYFYCYGKEVEFTLGPSQTELLKKVANMIWPLLEKMEAKQKEEKAA